MDVTSFFEPLLSEDFTFALPEEQIALFPTEERSGSRLLVADTVGQIRDTFFSSISDEIAPGSTLVLNESKVIAARLQAKKETGGAVEILLTSPLEPSDPALNLSSCGGSKVSWKAMIGGRKVKPGSVLHIDSGDHISLRAHVSSRFEKDAHIALEWEPAHLTLGQILEQYGSIPLPPYIKREQQDDDKVRYQTVYASKEGSVAAPTAGLHFTKELLHSLEAKGVHRHTITLHVGAGTFRPLESKYVHEHQMHGETFAVEKDTLRGLVAAARRREAGYPLIPVGTTGMRTLETLYWCGVEVLEKSVFSPSFVIDQWQPYRRIAEARPLPSGAEALEALERFLAEQGLDYVSGSTHLMIAPGYHFGLCDRLITNFHQPYSTLLLLVAAFIGKDRWKDIYRHALVHNYRFLSYGDSSLLTRASFHEPHCR